MLQCLAGQERLGKIARTVPYVNRFIPGSHRFATVAVRYAEGQLSAFGVAAVRRLPRSSRVVAAALLSEVAEVVTLPDRRSKVPEDRVRNRDVEEEVGQHQVPDVVFSMRSFVV